MVKILKTKESVLDKKQLEEYLAKLASDNSIKSNSDKSTYPIPRMKDNCKYISLVYTLLNEHIKIGIPIHPAGEWILDNFYIIEKSAKTIEKELTIKKYIKLPGLVDNGFARIYVLANEIISNTDGKINSEDLKEYLKAYQTQKNLLMEEIWTIGEFLQISIIEKVRHICEKIFISQMQKYKVDNIVQRLIENKPRKQIKISIGGEYPFIEYMSYKLKQYGKISNPYLIAFEDQVSKMGMTLSEVINREHFDIALRKLSMKNCITSIKNIPRIDIVEMFQEINIVEKILAKDPCNVYEKMDYETKAFYRAQILEISKKTKTSEIFVAEEALKLSQREECTFKKSHIGYYLIDKGKEELLGRLLNKKVHLMKKDTKAKIYVLSIYLLSIIITGLLFILIKFLAIILFIPIQNAITKIIQYILSKFKKAQIIPKINYQEGIPKEDTTMCVIPVILKSAEDVKEMMNKMEVYYLANKSENLFFTLLGDCTSGKHEIEKQDKEIIETGIKYSELLNQKYGEKFFFVYRKREWSNCETCFMGWERKRGILNQFNEYLKTGYSKFQINTCKNIPMVKYIITLDSDTNLVLDSAFELVGAMSHILNKPEIDKIKNIVLGGHALVQPRIGIDILSGRKTVFSRLFAGNGGTDLYTNAISDVYQDNFDEGIYTGKGIYDLDVFYTVLKDSIPEDTVLSHDLIEGSYLRCALASDIILIDGYPSNYNAYKIRKHRWIRGDVQIIPWIKSDLNFLSKYKIIDNMARNLNNICILLALIISMSIKNNLLRNVLIPIIIFSVPTLIKLYDNVMNKKKGTFKHRLFVANFSKWTHAIYTFLIELTIIPDMAFLELNAITKAIYRMKISHKNLLEWTTADEAERQSSNNFLKYIKTMFLEIITGIIFVMYPLGILWIASPIIMWALSQNDEERSKISKKDKQYLLEISKETWQYFKDNTINSLPVDNYQESRKNKMAKRTSPTNIGLSLLSIIASYDLKFENINTTLTLLNNSIDTIEKLEKWNGHLYNWYDLETLKPIRPYDISSVDSGNLVGYLYTTKQFLEEIKNNSKKTEEINNIKTMILKIDKIINDTDFSKLYNFESGLFSIGFNSEENKLYDSYYDLLASEARQTSLIAISKKDVPTKHWKNLGRTLTRLREHKGLVSWGGTAFEYLMPNINIPTYPSTLLDESCKLLIMSEKEYAKKLGIPWGMSESAYSRKDFFGNYQYKTFGIPWLGLKRGLADEVVASPYATIMALPIDNKDVISNMYDMEKEGLTGRYGFFDSIDYKPKKEVVKTYMAHHQGMILCSIDNALNNNIFQKRFMENPEMKGIKILLEENMPEDVIITKEKKDKVEKIKYNGYEEYPPRTNGINLISTNELSTVVTENGDGYTKLGDIILNNGVNIYIKDINSNKTWDSIETKHTNEFTPYSSKLKLENGSMKVTINTTIAPDCQVEIRKISIKNKGLQDLNLEVTSYCEPRLSTKEQYEAHPTFDKMFLRYKYEDNKIILSRKAKSENEKNIYVATTLFANNKKMEFEINKENFLFRGNTQTPDAVEKSLTLSNKIGIALNPIVAMRQIVNIKPNEKQEIYLITSSSVDESQTTNNLEEYMNNENLSRVFELSKAQTEAEIRYMEIKEKNISLYQNMLKYLIYPNRYFINREENQLNTQIDLSDQNLWKYGISGAYPIITVKIREENDYYVAREVFKAYEYFKSKNIKIELVILTNVDILDNISDDKMSKFLNQREGIFVLKNIKRDDKRIMEMRSNLIIDAHDGSLEIQMKELENKMKLTRKENPKGIDRNIEFVNEKESEKQNTNINIDFKNGFGQFNQDKTEYWIKENKANRIPLAWSNIMTNQKFGTVVTDALGGYTWYINSKTNRVTKFSNDAYMDKSSENFYLQDITNIEGSKESLTWSLDVNNMPDCNDYYICYGFGYSKYVHESKNIMQTLTVFVPKEDTAKVNIINLKNNNPFRKKIKINYDIQFQMGEKEDRYIQENYRENLNMFLVKNNKNPWYYTYIISDEKMDKNKAIEVELNAFEEKNIVIILGCEQNEMDCIDIGSKYTSNYENKLLETQKYWKDQVEKITAHTPMESFDILQNGWLVYQTLTSRLLGKTGFYQSSGGIGFRDQLQDAMGMKYIDTNILKEQILLHSKHQFTDGDVEHWWHEDSKLGVRTRYSDDLLWLPYAVIEYVEFTGDYSILNENTKYIKSEELKEDETDRVRNYYESEQSGSIFEHCFKAIKRSMKFGTHGLPLIGCGDWNDGMNKIGNKGEGESVWLGFFLYDILNRFIDLIKYEENFMKVTGISKEISIGLNGNDEEKKWEAENIQDINFIDYEKEAENFLKTANNIKRALNTQGWDGRWYKRAFKDNGDEAGSINCMECKIDSIAQSWAVISNAGDNDKKYISMESLHNYLVDEKAHLVKLLTPALEKENLGYISAYSKGMRENGGQYTHAAIWASIASAILNQNERAMLIYKEINPIEHAKTKEDILKYKVEPYVVEADIYSEDELAGRGGWTWYTGSSAWMYELQVKYILGIKIKKAVMSIKPCVPEDWKKFNAKFKWKNAIYNIKYTKIAKNEKNCIEDKIILRLNGKETSQIELKDNGYFEVEVEF